jgi:Zn-dependent peptidase ImmA (M78 family)
MHIFQEASPISRAELEELGWKVREILGLTKEKWLPVPYILEHSLTELYGDDFAFEVKTMNEMGANHGYADPNQRELILREDVYDGMVLGRGRDRMTGVHEMSHMILHPGNRLFRRMREEKPPPFRDPEWQAKCLAGTTMMPIRMLERAKSIRGVARDFGVSEDAAKTRVRQLGQQLPY